MDSITVKKQMKLPDEMYRKRPIYGVIKIFFAFSIIAICWVTIYYQRHFNEESLFLVFICMVIAGFMYAHLIELEHELLHHHMFNSARTNRFFGVLCGMFMLISFSHYKIEHLKHHAYLGTKKNTEHFDYRFNNLNSIRGFIRALFDLGRYRKVIGYVFTSDIISTTQHTRKIKQEYRLYLALLVASIIYSLYAHDDFFVFAWYLPLLVAEAVHFMIELPEHFGLNTQTDSNVFYNTRTVPCSKIAKWYVNGNNLHTAHHYNAGVPMTHIDKLNSLVTHNMHIVEKSYFNFYLKVIKGEIVPYQ